MDRPFDQQGKERTQEQFDEELKALSWTVEGDFVHLLDTNYSKSQVEAMERHFENTGPNAWERNNRQHLSGMTDMMGFEMDPDMQACENKESLTKRFVERVRKIGNTVLVSFGEPPKF